MRGGGDFCCSVALWHTVRPIASRFPATGEFFLDGQYVDLLAGMIHRHEGRRRSVGGGRRKNISGRNLSAMSGNASCSIRQAPMTASSEFGCVWLHILCLFSPYIRSEKPCLSGKWKRGR